MSRSFQLVAPIAAVVSLGLSATGQAEPVAQLRERSFRPIVPIKQNVSDGEALQRTQTISVKIPPSIEIPPPPIPAPESSLFPENSIPEIDFPPETYVETEPDGEFDVTDQDVALPGEKRESASNQPTLSRLREEAHKLANEGLTYKFGSDDPDDGGLDCSGAMQHLLTEIGIKDVPRTSYNQYYWLKKKKMLDDVYGKNSGSKLLKKLAPGDLIFWGGTWKSGHRVSHVMLYMGYNPNEDKHYVFGARGKSTKGMLGNGVDVFELDPDRGRLIAHGKIPGLVYD